MTLLTLLLLINAVLLTGICTLFIFFRRRLAELKKHALSTEQARAAMPQDVLARSLQASDRRIVIEILNPMAVAAQESKFAGLFGSLTPALIRNTVYEKAAKILKLELLERGVEADVTVKKNA